MQTAQPTHTLYDGIECDIILVPYTVQGHICVYVLLCTYFSHIQGPGVMIL